MQRTDSHRDGNGLGRPARLRQQRPRRRRRDARARGDDHGPRRRAARRDRQEHHRADSRDGPRPQQRRDARDGNRARRPASRHRSARARKCSSAPRASRGASRFRVRSIGEDGDLATIAAGDGLGRLQRRVRHRGARPARRRDRALDGQRRRRDRRGRPRRLRRSRTSTARVRLVGAGGSGSDHTVNGDVDATFAQRPRSRRRFKTVNGERRRHVPRRISSAELAFQTMHGDVFTDFDVESLERPAGSATGASAARSS